MTEKFGMTGTTHMTDLFFRIAERALRLTPTIQPMITPLFASIVYADSEEVFDIVTDEAQGSQSSVTSQASTTPENKPYIEPDLQSFVSGISSNDAPVAHQSDISLVTHVERRAIPYPEIEQPPAQTYVPTSAQPVAAQMQHITSVKNTHIPSAIDNSAHRVIPVIERPGDRQEERQSTFTPLTSVQPLPAILPPLSFTGQKAPRPTEAVIHTQHRPHDNDIREGREGLSRARSVEQHRGEMRQKGTQTNQDAPAIHVTIGRIEVRANPVPSLQTRPQHRQSVPKTMSLDEYLKQSEKGGH